MSELNAQATPWRADVIADFARSELFDRTFQEGMVLVEETAAYLDGPGRDISKTLPRGEALAYSSESMRLTTRLMQLASWLLLQRAVNEGEITVAQASTEKRKVRLSRQDLATHTAMFEMEGRVEPQAEKPNPVQAQQSLLASAFRN